MENKINKNEAVLLPKYFRNIGLAVITIALTLAVMVNSAGIEMFSSNKELFRVFSYNSFILGLLFVAWSKDKVEDEMTFAIRLKAMALAFGGATLCVVIKPMIDLLLGDPIQHISGQQVVVSMLFFYLLIYYFQKMRR